MTDIKQLLKHSEFQAIRNANAPALANPFATMADLTGSGGITSVQPGTNIEIDNTDPANPIVNNVGSNVSKGTVFEADSKLAATLPGGPGVKNNINPAGWLVAGVPQATLLDFTIIGPGNDSFGGLAAPTDGKSYLVIVHNEDPTGTITLVDNSATSLAANRFLIGGSVTLGSNESLALLYDTDISRWIPFSKF